MQKKAFDFLRTLEGLVGFFEYGGNMVELKTLEYLYSKNYRDVFENIAALLFCDDIGLSSGVNSRINQKAIESDPVKIKDKCYAFQAKYYEASTKLSDQRNDFVTSIKGASLKDVSDLYFFVNKEMPDTDPRTGKETSFVNTVQGEAELHSITLHWWTLKKIERSLEMPKYNYITAHYFNPEKRWIDVSNKYAEYQNYVDRIYTKCEPRNKLLGEESLSDLYMEQSYYASEKKFGDVDQLIEDFCVTGKNGVLWIVGEPGHGKTSMCIKAVADYIYRERYQSVNGVFWFCLNPQRTPKMIENSSLILQRAFSWNPTSGSCSEEIAPDAINGSLVFLDGFDELKSSLEKTNISSNQFYSQVNEIAEVYNLHIVVTSRRQALEQEKYCKEDNLKRGVGKISCKFSNGSTQDNDVRLLAPMSPEKQIAWIDRLIKWREKKLCDTSKLVKYRQRFPALHTNKDVAQLFNIPILLRMIVHNCFEPTSGNRVELYRDLFDTTLRRQGLENNVKALKDIYQQIAYKIFVYDNESAEISKDEFKEIDSIDAYLYQYYLYSRKAKEGSDSTDVCRVAFLHKTFYQYFLSEFLYEKLIAVKDKKSGEELLKLLWSRHLEKYVLENLQVMTKIDTIQYSWIIEAVNNTDCFFHDYAYESRDIVGNYDRANNSFWNILSILNYIIPVEEKKAPVLSERIVKLLSLFNCSNINLSDFVLESVDLNDARLVFADLSGTDLSYADLCSARLELADLRFTKMNGADLVSASLSSSDLSNSDLSYADLSGANLNSAYMNYTTLSDTILCNANFSDADLSDADLCNANLVGAILENTKMVGADVENARVTKSQYEYISNQGVKNLDKIIVEEE